MRRVFPQVVLSSAHAIAARSTFRPSRILHKLARTLAINLLFAAVGNVFASPYVEFDIGPTAECRDVTPAQRLTLYPSQRVIEVALPVSVRFHGASMEDVEELAIEVNGASANLQVVEFSPTTQLASDISHEIELTSTTKKNRAL